MSKIAVIRRGLIHRGLLLPLLVLSLAAAAPDRASETTVVVLGIAQDGGIPQIGCNQEICRTQKHGISSLAILHQNSIYLIDASPDLRDQYAELSRRNPSYLHTAKMFDGIFLTHAHMGHYAGLLYLGNESISTKQTPLHCSTQMASYLRNNAPWKLLAQNENIAINTFVAEKSLDFGFKITPLEVPHRKEFTDTHGFLIQGKSKSLLYIPDIDAWEPVREELVGWLARVDYALVDGTFFSGNELPGRDMTKIPHPTIEHSITFFKSLPEFSAEIFFTHLNHTNPVLVEGTPEANSVKNAGYQIAVDWQEFHL